MSGIFPFILCHWRVTVLFMDVFGRGFTPGQLGAGKSCIAYMTEKPPLIASCTEQLSSLPEVTTATIAPVTTQRVRNY